MMPHILLTGPDIMQRQEQQQQQQTLAVDANKAFDDVVFDILKVDPDDIGKLKIYSKKNLKFGQIFLK